MGKIVAIGGGDLWALQTLPIDQEIVALSGKPRPRVLFIPTARSDSEDYWKAFQATYRRTLGCETDVLYLLRLTMTRQELEAKIMDSDVIYVGGGNTLKMMRRWRRLGVDKLLEAAYRRGIVLSGVSAGCICWFTYGHSDSMSFYHPERWSYIRVRGLGLIDAIVCPHYSGETAGVQRRDQFHAMVRQHPDVGIGVEDNCALEFVDGSYRVITSQAGAGAYVLHKKRSELLVRPIEQRKAFRPLAELLAR